MIYNYDILYGCIWLGYGCIWLGYTSRAHCVFFTWELHFLLIPCRRTRRWARHYTQWFCFWAEQRSCSWIQWYCKVIHAHSEGCFWMCMFRPYWKEVNLFFRSICLLKRWLPLARWVGDVGSDGINQPTNQPILRYLRPFTAPEVPPWDLVIFLGKQWKTLISVGFHDILQGSRSKVDSSKSMQICVKIPLEGKKQSGSVAPSTLSLDVAKLYLLLIHHSVDDPPNLGSNVIRFQDFLIHPRCFWWSSIL